MKISKIRKWLYPVLSIILLVAITIGYIQKELNINEISIVILGWVIILEIKRINYGKD